MQHDEHSLQKRPVLTFHHRNEKTSICTGLTCPHCLRNDSASLPDTEGTISPMLPLPTLSWYKAHIQHLAEAEQQAAMAKLAKYGFGQDDVFALLRCAAARTHTGLWPVLLTWMDRCMHLDPETPMTHRVELLKDLFGYCCLALALCKWHAPPDGDAPTSAGG